MFSFLWMLLTLSSVEASTDGQFLASNPSSAAARNLGTTCHDCGVCRCVSKQTCNWCDGMGGAAEIVNTYTVGGGSSSGGSSPGGGYTGPVPWLFAQACGSVFGESCFSKSYTFCQFAVERVLSFRWFLLLRNWWTAAYAKTSHAAPATIAMVKVDQPLLTP